MRNGQNKRMRGRNRKSHNPLTRVYESNGPDIKIRGTASHVAEKYVQLARDAQSSGDPVAAENYYQHAEHYFRLIAAVQEQFRQTQPNFYRPDGGPGNDTHGGNDMQDEVFDDGEDDGAMAPMQGSGAEQPSFGTRDPQPYLPRDAQFFSPREQQYGGRPPQQQGGERQRAPTRAMSTGCRPSSPAASRSSRKRRSKAWVIRVGSRTARTATTIKAAAIVSRCTAVGVAIAARAATCSAAAASRSPAAMMRGRSTASDPRSSF